VPILTPPDVNGIEAKIGDATVLLMTVFPFDSTCDGSKVDPFEITIFTGMMTIGIVAELLGKGGTPT